MRHFMHNEDVAAPPSLHTTSLGAASLKRPFCGAGEANCATSALQHHFSMRIYVDAVILCFCRCSCHLGCVDHCEAARLGHHCGAPQPICDDKRMMPYVQCRCVAGAVSLSWQPRCRGPPWQRSPLTACMRRPRGRQTLSTRCKLSKAFTSGTVRFCPDRNIHSNRTVSPAALVAADDTSGEHVRVVNGTCPETSCIHVSQAPAAGQRYDWVHRWYPMAIEADLDAGRTHAVHLLGRPLVRCFCWRVQSMTSEVSQLGIQNRVAFNSASICQRPQPEL